METKTKLNQKREKGITLVALIITIVVMVIISAVSIMLVYRTEIVEYGINGTQNYAQEGINENEVLERTESLIESAVDNIKKINEGIIADTEPNPPTPPEETGLPKEELEREEMIGRYVDYNPQGTDYTVDGTYSGTGSNQTFSKNDDMKWRIWGVEGNKLLLISETLAGNITLKGAEGYNNAVKILNDACAQAYGNSSYGSRITVRSINQDDIDEVTNMTTDEQRKKASSYYGTTYTPNNKRCPSIYDQELEKTEGGSLDRSNQSTWYSNTTTFTIGKYTYYKFNIRIYSIKVIYYALLTNMSSNSTSGTTIHDTYWVASRCAYFLQNNSYGLFSVFCVKKGFAEGDYLYNSDGANYSLTYAIRPMVEVNMDSVAIGASGLGTNIDPYSMALK